MLYTSNCVYAASVLYLCIALQVCVWIKQLCIVMCISLSSIAMPAVLSPGCVLPSVSVCVCVAWSYTSPAHRTLHLSLPRSTAGTSNFPVSLRPAHACDLSLRPVHTGDVRPVTQNGAAAHHSFFFSPCSKACAGKFTFLKTKKYVIINLLHSKFS